MELVVDGQPVACHTGGVAFDPARPAVLFLHGAGMDHTTWRFQARALAHRGFAVAAPDLPGHGGSPGKPIPSIPELAAWSMRLCDALHVERVAVVGYSMGSLVGIELAADAPDLVERLVLIATSDRMGVHPELMAAAEAADPLAAELMVGWMHTGDQRLGGHPQPGTWSPALTRRILGRHLEVLAADLAACADYPAGERAGGIAAPTLVIAGSDDKMTPPAAGRRVAEAIRGASLEVVTDAGHTLPFDHPREVTDALAGFLSGDHR